MLAMLCLHVFLLTSNWPLLQEHAEQAHMVRQLVIEANTLVQQTAQLQVRLDKDVEKLKVSQHCNVTLCNAYLASCAPQFNNMLLTTCVSTLSFRNDLHGFIKSAGMPRSIHVKLFTI